MKLSMKSTKQRKQKMETMGHSLLRPLPHLLIPLEVLKPIQTKARVQTPIQLVSLLVVAD